MSGMRATISAMKIVTDRDIEKIPARNLRVSRAVFGEFWREVEAYAAAETARGASTTRTAGLVLTCRWVACSTTEVNGRRFLAIRPVGFGDHVAYEELIEAEYVAAEMALVRGPETGRFVNKPGYVESVCTVLRWVWRRNGPRPIIDPTTAESAAS
jgi:hypothetical protein